MPIELRNQEQRNFSWASAGWRLLLAEAVRFPQEFDGVFHKCDLEFCHRFILTRSARLRGIACRYHSLQHNRIDYRTAVDQPHAGASGSNAAENRERGSGYTYTRRVYLS